MAAQYLQQFSDNHPDHDRQWTVSLGAEGHDSCVACLIELLEDEDLLSTKKKMVLTEFMMVLQERESNVLSLLSADSRVLMQLMLILLGVFNFVVW